MRCNKHVFLIDFLFLLQIESNNVIKRVYQFYMCYKRFFSLYILIEHWSCAWRFYEIVFIARLSFGLIWNYATINFQLFRWISVWKYKWFASFEQASHLRSHCKLCNKFAFAWWLKQNIIIFMGFGGKIYESKGQLVNNWM